MGQMVTVEEVGTGILHVILAKNAKKENILKSLKASAHRNDDVSPAVAAGYGTIVIIDSTRRTYYSKISHARVVIHTNPTFTVQYSTYKQHISQPTSQKFSNPRPRKEWAGKKSPGRVLCFHEKEVLLFLRVKNL